MGTTEDIILRHTGRGMDILREYLPEDFCSAAAREILSWKKGKVLITTGFYVAGYAETDGPAGSIVLAGALSGLGYEPLIVTDSFCQDFFEPEGIETVYLPLEGGDEACRKILRTYEPVGMISIERCGENIQGDYANMRGISIREHTAKCDRLFDLGRRAGIRTIGVGDGGNEIGMGNLAEVISSRLSLVPCRTRTDLLVIASVSNWGAYGMAAELQRLTGEPVYCAPGDRELAHRVHASIERMVEIGSVDGVTHERIGHVDGFGESVETEILEALAENIV